MMPVPGGLGCPSANAKTRELESRRIDCYSHLQQHQDKEETTADQWSCLLSTCTKSIRCKLAAVGSLKRPHREQQHGAQLPDMTPCPGLVQAS
ncbi:Hypothetical predicted protein [Marmota monax]|uniref:Uncharacterized protein n=1 Tax=Marmota monax TaxID=9995 RepID=A0A5E4BQ42_MARMO|nr:Hypothetical predicted protein [Marmota monax]